MKTARLLKIRSRCASATRPREQMQLDIYGEMLDSFFHAQHAMRRHNENDFRVLVLMLERLEAIWQNPDQGIWETRGRPQHFTYSKMMAWVAFDRAVLLAKQLNYDAPWKNGSPYATLFTSRSAPRPMTKRRRALRRPTARTSSMLLCC